LQEPLHDSLKTLHLIRHAKSDWSLSGQRDFDRALNHRGERDAPLMASLFAKYPERPSLILCSTAVRARSTAEFYLHELKMPPEQVQYTDEIYEARWDTLLQMINGLDNTYDVVALFGHNPGFSQLCTFLTGQVIEMPTCAVVTIQFEFDDWAMVSGQTGDLIRFDFPKKH